MKLRGTALLLAQIAMVIGVIALVVGRPRDPHKAPAEVPDAPAVADAGADAATSAATSAKPPVSAAVPSATVRETPKPILDRPFRVAGMGWELLVPGAVPDGRGDAGAGALNVDLASEAQASGLEARFARGGADAQGADLLVMPLPDFVASYEKLRALDPQIIAVVGRARGAIELRQSKDAPKPGEDVKVISTGDRSAELLALYVIEGTGAPLDKVRFVRAPAADSPEAKGAHYMLVPRGAPADGARTLVSSADASGLVPLVAVAPRAQLEPMKAAYAAWAERWTAGTLSVKKDAPGAARAIVGRPGAPDPVALVERMGQIDWQEAITSPRSLVEDAWSAQGGFARSWQLMRAAGILGTPPPEKTPVTAALPQPVAPIDGGSPSPGVAPGNVTAPPVLPGKAMLALRAAESLDERSVAVRTAEAASIFERFNVRVTMKGGEKPSKSAALTARDLARTAGSRVHPGSSQVPQGAAALIEIVPEGN